MEKTTEDAVIRHNVTLTAKVLTFPAALRLSYTVSNHGREDIFVLDVLPGVDSTTRRPVADPSFAYIAWGGDRIVHLLRGIPPLPADRSVMVRVIPLGTKLAAGASLERTLELALPLREQSPYYGFLERDQYTEMEVKTMRLTVQYLGSSVQGFGSEETAYGPGLYRVWGNYTVGQAEKLDCDLPLKEIKLLKRTDNFTRI